MFRDELFKHLRGVSEDHMSSALAIELGNTLANMGTQADELRWTVARRYPVTLFALALPCYVLLTVI